MPVYIYLELSAMQIPVLIIYQLLLKEAALIGYSMVIS